MHIDLIPVQSLTKDQYRKFSRLNLGDKGLMKFYLKTAFDGEAARLKLRRNELIISLSDNGKVLAWVLLLDFRACYACRWKKSIHVYTRSSCRGKGYASILIHKAIALSAGKKIYCRGNAKFFAKYGIKYA